MLKADIFALSSVFITLVAIYLPYAFIVAQIGGNVNTIYGYFEGLCQLDKIYNDFRNITEFCTGSGKVVRFLDYKEEFEL